MRTFAQVCNVTVVLSCVCFRFPLTYNSPRTRQLSLFCELCGTQDAASSLGKMCFNQRPRVITAASYMHHGKWQKKLPTFISLWMWFPRPSTRKPRTFQKWRPIDVAELWGRDQSWFLMYVCEFVIVGVVEAVRAIYAMCCTKHWLAF